MERQEAGLFHHTLVRSAASSSSMLMDVFQAALRKKVGTLQETSTCSRRPLLLEVVGIE
jgi:hypothetical protein